jgi:hypothetical protein
MRILTGVICVRVTDREFQAFQAICDKHRVSRQDLLRAVLVDVLVEEGFDALRCEQPPGCESGRETGEAA